MRCIENFFTVHDFWATCAYPQKQSLPWIQCIEYIFYIQDFLETCSCPEKQSVPWYFSRYWIYFLHSGFLSNLRLPWNYSPFWIIFYHSGSLSNLRLPWNFSSPGGGRPLRPPTSYVYDQMHFKHEQSQFLSPDSHVTTLRFSKYRTQPMCYVHWVAYIDTIVGMRLDQRSYWDSWKLVRWPWRYQHGIWIGEKN